MPRFFIDYVPEERATLTGDDARHISRSLRMQPGESLILCDSIGTDYQCEIEHVSEESVVVRILHYCVSVAEPSVQVTVYQGLPKADKMDSIVQKSVETGAVCVVPVMTARCVSKPDEKSAAKKNSPLAENCTGSREAERPWHYSAHCAAHFVPGGCFGSGQEWGYDSVLRGRRAEHP